MARLGAALSLRWPGCAGLNTTGWLAGLGSALCCRQDGGLRRREGLAWHGAAWCSIRLADRLAAGWLNVASGMQAGGSMRGSARVVSTWDRASVVKKALWQGLISRGERGARCFAVWLVALPMQRLPSVSQSVSRSLTAGWLAGCVRGLNIPCRESESRAALLCVTRRGVVGSTAAARPVIIRSLTGRLTD